MLRNYLTTALRNLWKNKFYSFINIFGLALGIACFLFILIFVKDELSYDRYHEHAGRIYRMHFFGKIFEQEIDIPQVGDPWGPLLAGEFPEVELQFRFRETGPRLARYEEKSFREERLIFADSTLFDLFSFNLLKGNPKTALSEPFTIVITPEIAARYFGGEEPIGKSLIFNDDQPYRVTSMVEPMPDNTHFSYDIFMSMASTEESRSQQWMSFNFHTYLLLKEGADPRALEEKFPQIAKTYLGAQLEQFVGTTWEEFIAGGNDFQFTLFPLKDIHLYSHTSGELAPPGDIKYIYIFSFIGLFIILLACINFMNLSTARSAGRAREVGMRKVVGARRGQLITQFLSESVVISLLSLVIAAALLAAMLPAFNDLSGKVFSLADISRPWLWGAMILVVVAVGLLSGSYPALFLSGFQPIRVLKGRIRGGVGGAWLRNALVVFQFAITIGLIVGTIVIYNQLHFIQNKKLGFDKEHLLILNNASGLGDNLNAFKQEMLKQPQVVNATVTSFLPTPSGRNNNGTFLGRNPRPEDTHVLQSWWVDEDFVETLGIEMLAGRDFATEFPGDSSAAILNESAVRIFGLKDPLGEEVGNYSGDGDNEAAIRTYRIIGVFKDFHYESLRERIGPMVIYLGRSTAFLALRIKGDDIPGLVASIQRHWDEMAPGKPFEYNFLDDRFGAMYEAETRVGQIITVFTVLAIFIACLGLFGLATFTAEQRTKEIGIRKVLGAPVGRIFLLLTSDFTRWVLLANVIALPLAYLVMKRWLEGFEYQAGISPAALAAAAAAALLVAWLTVSYQAVRAARSNPVRALKYE